jgi:hypothetical protein
VNTDSTQEAMAKLLKILDEKDCLGKWQIFKQSLFEDGKFILYQMNIITRFKPMGRFKKFVPQSKMLACIIVRNRNRRF